MKIKRDMWTNRSHANIKAPALRRKSEPLLDRMHACRAYLFLMGYVTAGESDRIGKRIEGQRGKK